MTYNIPIDFTSLPDEQDITPKTRVTIDSKLWYRYINSLPVAKFNVHTYEEDDENVLFSVSDSLEFVIGRKKLVDGDKFYLKVTQVILTGEKTDVKGRRLWTYFFMPHNIQIGSANSGLNIQYKTVMPLLQKFGVARLLGVDIRSLVYGSKFGATINDVNSITNAIEFH